MTTPLASAAAAATILLGLAALAADGTTAFAAGPHSFNAVSLKIDRVKPPQAIAHKFCTGQGFDGAGAYIFLGYEAGNSGTIALFRQISCFDTPTLSDKVQRLNGLGTVRVLHRLDAKAGTLSGGMLPAAE